MTRPRLICLHGWTMRSAVFDALIARLPEIEILAPDLPGHGTQGQGFDACIAQLDTLLSQEAPSVVLGWSMGAAIAWAFIERHGTAKLSGLITIDMSPRIWNGPGWPHGLIGQDAERLAKTTAEIHADWPGAAQKIMNSMFAEKTDVPLMSLDAALRQVLDNDPAAMAAYWDEMAAMDLRTVAAQVNIPWLIAHGGKSRVYPSTTATWLAAQGTDTQRVCFEHSGHSPHLEEPDAFAAQIETFMTRVANRNGTL